MSNRLKKYIPNEFKQSIYEIDFLSLYDKGYRLLLIDIDNTLASYKTVLPTKDNLKLIKSLQEMGFEVILISNNNYKRVSVFTENINDVRFVHFALKPFKRGYKKALKIAKRKYEKHEIISIGDQLMTDVKGTNKMGFYSILVRPIERRTDVLTTKINRFFENRKLKKIKKKYPELYEEVLKDYESM